MEMIVLLSLSISTFILVAITLWWWRKQTEDDVRPLPLPTPPPGKTGWPIIGETLEFLSFNKKGNPETFIMDRMRNFSTKVFKTPLMNENVAVFCGASGNKFLFKNAAEFTSIWIPSPLLKLFTSPENGHSENSIGKVSIKLAEFRKLTTDFLNPEFIQQKLVPVMDQMAKKELEEYYCKSQQQQQQAVQVQVLEVAKTYTFNLACRLILSVDNPKIVKICKDLFKDIMGGLSVLPINFPGTAFNRAVKSSVAFRKEIVSILKQRKLQISSSNEQKDLLSRILDLTFERDGEFPRDALLVDLIIGFFVAGTDTTTSTTTCSIKHLAEFPHVYAQVLQEQMEIAKNKKPGDLLNWEDVQKMKYTWCVVQETLRLTPPSLGTFRQVDRDFSYAGFTIPKGWKAYWTVASSHKNPEYFENPECFDPSRFQDSSPPPYSFVPFGGGSHICPGRQFGKILILVFIHNLVTQFHFEKILPNEKIEYSMTNATPVNGLPVYLQPRNGQI